MNPELFIARKMATGKGGNSRLSRPNVIISLASIILGVSIMIVSTSVVTAFQEGIREKVIGFGSHIRVKAFDSNNSMESSPVEIQQDFYPSLEEDENVRKIQIYAYKPAILQTFRDSVEFELQNADTTTLASTQDMIGVLFKGVDQNYDWDFFEDKLVKGRMVEIGSENDEVMISSYVANLMGYELNDELEAFFIVNSKFKKRNYEIVGIYDTGFEQFDQKFVFTDIKHLQKLNNWGIQTYVTIRDSCINNYFVLECITFGGNQNYRYQWGEEGRFESSRFYAFDPRFESELKVISSDFNREGLGSKPVMNTIPDTAIVKINLDSACTCSKELLANSPIERISDSLYQTPFGSVIIDQGTGTQHLYAGGFEIMLESWDDLDNMDDIIRYNIPFNFETEKITEAHPEIFAWLNFLDYNVAIIIALILAVSLINMITSLLVLILEKTNMIGVLKAVGANNKSVRRIFIYHSLFLLTRGLFWGNLLGIGLIAIQYYTGIFTLNPEIYYLETVPVKFSLSYILFINVLTIITCRIVLIIPSILASRIRPIQAIRFD